MTAAAENYGQMSFDVDLEEVIEDAEATQGERAYLVLGAVVRQLPAELPEVHMAEEMRQVHWPNDATSYPLPCVSRPDLPYLLYGLRDLGIEAVATHGICSGTCLVCYRCAATSDEGFHHQEKRQCLQMDGLRMKDDDGCMVLPFSCSWCNQRFEYNAYVRHRTYECRYAECTFPDCDDVHERREAEQHRKTDLEGNIVVTLGRVRMMRVNTRRSVM
ncbi:hypothetical protein M427DRAFT_39971 [Gonapodya prolifera JEL478]|uniref:Uncharacterized protein n=1 Tax=Gonapodya prolifera (strain JEL478) TaxID=1344416 RepID=A0A138ZWB9_GONPJ|nr:hypothetical protein M427DRAFT_39971 [Gonapodya prolifera JEL478]|eukprot:KXS08786.1 hypothetical protein M427DRAFT_39971 [Gonapodya prolifera JEL478]